MLSACTLTLSLPLRSSFDTAQPLGIGCYSLTVATRCMVMSLSTLLVCNNVACIAFLPMSHLLDSTTEFNINFKLRPNDVSIAGVVLLLFCIFFSTHATHCEILCHSCKDEELGYPPPNVNRESVGEFSHVNCISSHRLCNMW